MGIAPQETPYQPPPPPRLPEEEKGKVIIQPESKEELRETLGKYLEDIPTAKELIKNQDIYKIPVPRDIKGNVAYTIYNIPGLPKLNRGERWFIIEYNNEHYATKASELTGKITESYEEVAPIE